MKSLRTIYSKIAHIPSGSAADRLTTRQKQVRRLCYFLKSHLKTRVGLSNLPRKSPRIVMVCILKYSHSLYTCMEALLPITECASVNARTKFGSSSISETQSLPSKCNIPTFVWIKKKKHFNDNCMKQNFIKYRNYFSFNIHTIIGSNFRFEQQMHQIS